MNELIFSKYRKSIFICLSVLILVFGLLILSKSYHLIGKTFPGFSYEVTMLKAPSTPLHWQGFEIPDYSQVIEINGKK